MGVLFNGGQKAEQSKTLLILENTSGIFLHREWRATNMEQKSPKDIQEPNKPSVPSFHNSFVSIPAKPNL